MIPRIPPAVAVTLLLLSALLSPARADTNISLTEGLLRAKPAVVLVIAEVASEVTLDCGSGPTTVKPPAFRETGTGWFVDDGPDVIS